MKTIKKCSVEPQGLADFRTQNPQATWDDAHNYQVSGKSIPQICCAQSSNDQSGLCAYCEKELKGNHPRVEHFHPKSDTSDPTKNYALLWVNMLAVCDGNSSSDESTKPKSARLHCDAYKNVQVQNGKLLENCDGYLLNPLALPPDYNFFAFDMASGELKANATICTAHNLAGNLCANTQELVEGTIKHLNLNNSRLCELRRKKLHSIDKTKKFLRQKHTDIKKYNAALMERYFQKKWPEFFTTVRCILGQSAEEYLQQINYKG